MDDQRQPTHFTYQPTSLAREVSIRRILGSVALLLALSALARPAAAQAQSRGIFDSTALVKLLAPLKKGPSAPQPVLLAFAEDGSLDRLALSENIDEELRTRLRDSLPHVVRTDSVFANLRVRLYLVAAKPLMLVPACDELPPQFIEPTNDDIDRVLKAGQQPRTTAVVTVDGPASQLTPREIDRAVSRSLPTPVSIRLTVGMVVMPGGKIRGATVSSLERASSYVVTGPRSLDALSIKSAPGAAWTTACLFRTVVETTELPKQ